MLHSYILLVGICLPLISASIYPTQPVQATVWSADQPMLVSWVEDWKYPTLSEMGPVDISLWSDTDTYLVQLASTVDPMAKTRQVTVPGRALKQGSKYTLRFTTSKPIDTVVYSADFTIIPANTTIGSAAGAGAGTGSGAVALATQSAGTGAGAGTGTDTGAGVGTGSGFKTVPTTAGSSTTTTTTTTTTTSASDRFGSTTPSGVPPPSGTIPGGGIPEAQRAVSAGRRGVDVEKLKFRFVFVIWPVLMGITMAL